MDNNDWLKQLLMVGIGTTSLVAEKLKEVSEQWVKDGKIDPEGAKAFVDDFMMDKLIEFIKVYDERLCLCSSENYIKRHGDFKEGKKFFEEGNCG